MRRGGHQKVTPESAGKAAESTKTRIIEQSLELFAKKGYYATTVAQIEKAAGLRPGSGGLYAHFSSKEEVLHAVVENSRSQIETLYSRLRYLPGRSLNTQLVIIGRATLTILDAHHALVRFLFRDYEQFPDLLGSLRKLVIEKAFDDLKDWVREAQLANGWEGEADVLVTVGLGSLANYWILDRILGASPLGLSEDRFLRGWSVHMATAIGAQSTC